MSYPFCEHIKRSFSPIFSLVGIEDGGNSVFTQILTLFGTLKGKGFGVKQTRAYLKNVSEEHKKGFNKILLELFIDNEKVKSQGIEENLQVLFRTRGLDMNDLVYQTFCRLCFFFHSGGQNKMKQEKGVNMLKDFYMFCMKDEEFDLEAMQEMVKSNQKQGILSWESVNDYYFGEDEMDEGGDEKGK